MDDKTMLKYCCLLLATLCSLSACFSSSGPISYMTYHTPKYCVPTDGGTPTECYLAIQNALTPAEGETISNITVQMMSFSEGTLANDMISSTPSQLVFLTSANYQNNQRYAYVYNTMKNNHWPIDFIAYPNGGIYHVKTTTVLKRRAVDGKYDFMILEGSGNYTNNAMYNNYEDLIILDSGWFGTDSPNYQNMINLVASYIERSLSQDQRKVMLGKYAARAGLSYSTTCNYFTTDPLLNAVDQKVCSDA